MDKKELRLSIHQLQDAQEKNSVKQVVFHMEDGSTFTVDDKELTRLLLDNLVIGLESRRHKELVKDWGEFRTNIENTPEYKVAMQLESDLNNMCFDNRNFVESIPFMHRTIQQNMFRLFRDSFLYMASLDERYIDGRNRGAYETGKKIAEILRESCMPFI